MPKIFENESKVEQGGSADTAVEEKDIVVNQICKGTYDLKDLVNEITDENRQSEVDWGHSVGSEFV